MRVWCAYILLELVNLGFLRIYMNFFFPLVQIDLLTDNVTTTVWLVLDRTRTICSHIFAYFDRNALNCNPRVIQNKLRWEKLNLKLYSISGGPGL